MGYAILCDARLGEGLGIGTLALVDRKKCKTRWWTSDDPSVILHYHKLEAAKFALRRLHHNDPRIVSSEHAVLVIREQAQEIQHQQALADCEAGWDGHKSI